MMDEAIRRADEALTEMVELSRSGKTSCAELRRGLESSKALSAKLDVYQANSASVLAVCESHGDGGAGVLAQAAGLPRRAAAAQVKTAERLQSMPDVQQAVETGQVSFANAKALADAADKTSADAIAEDSELLALPPKGPPPRLTRRPRRPRPLHHRTPRPRPLRPGPRPRLVAGPRSRLAAGAQP